MHNNLEDKHNNMNKLHSKLDDLKKELSHNKDINQKLGDDMDSKVAAFSEILE